MAIYLVTGASSGLGEAMSTMLAARGHTVYGIARRQEKLDEMRKLIGDSFIPFVCDVSDDQSVAATCEALPEVPDVAILNAGIGIPSSKHDFDMALYRETMEVNFFGVIRFVHHLFPKMRDRGGKIVGVSSLAGYRGLPMAGPYSASKGALTNAFESMAITYRKYPVQFVTIHPGFVATPMNEKNKFPMPFIWKTERAAEYMLNGIEKGKANIEFPIPLRLPTRLATLLPAKLYRAIVK